MSRHLPPEICAYICEQVDPAQLGPVCRVSRLLRDQAQRILYRTVNLRERNMKSVRSWCLAVTRRPHLAERVHSLSLQPPSDLDPADTKRISIALRKCTNLKSLTVLHVRIPYTSGSLHTWMLEDCPFRLTTFTNSYFNPRKLEKIWDTQREIRVLSLQDSPEFPASDTQLPNLIALELSTVHELDVKRPLQRLQIHFHQQSFSHLSHFSATLTTLNLLRIWTRNEPIVDVVVRVVHVLPALVHFGITEPDRIETRHHRSYHPEASPISALKGFTRIETLILQTRSISEFTEDPPDPARQDPSDLHAFGVAIMDACPTLRQAVLGAESPTGSERTCTLTRAAGQEMHSEEGTDFDFEAVSKFWSG
ncbi:hypothetical protein C8J57DRAFT_1706551 [Mycena rebaudengoi]|nr:hypothetical protein C8J57DRAFT_1706551 [Mycena rebaudengoi]